MPSYVLWEDFRNPNANTLAIHHYLVVVVLSLRSALALPHAQWTDPASGRIALMPTLLCLRADPWLGLEYI